MQLNDIHYAQSLLNTLYGIEMDDDDFEELALIPFRLIGNKRYKINRAVVCVDDCSEGVELPCGIDQLEAVTTHFDDWDYVSLFLPNGNIYSAFTELYIELRKAFRDPLYIPGKFIKYELVGDKLYFDHPHGQINILYRTEVLDENDLPQVTDSEAMAIATYIAYITKFKEGLATNNANTVLMAGALLALWKIQCDQARTDYYMNLNEMDQVLDSHAFGNRKQAGYSFKPYR